MMICLCPPPDRLEQSDSTLYVRSSASPRSKENRFSAFGLNAVVAILGFWTPERAAWAAFVRKCFGFSLTECGDTAAGFLMVVVFDWLSHGQARRFGRLAGSGPGYA
jgi:hypothetical protein